MAPDLFKGFYGLAPDDDPEFYQTEIRSPINTLYPLFNVVNDDHVVNIVNIPFSNLVERFTSTATDVKTKSSYGISSLTDKRQDVTFDSILTRYQHLTTLIINLKSNLEEIPEKCDEDMRLLAATEHLVQRISQLNPVEKLSSVSKLTDQETMKQEEDSLGKSVTETVGVSAVQPDTSPSVILRVPDNHRSVAMEMMGMRLKRLESVVGINSPQITRFKNSRAVVADAPTLTEFLASLTRCASLLSVDRVTSIEGSLIAALARITQVASELSTNGKLPHHRSLESGSTQIHKLSEKLDDTIRKDVREDLYNIVQRLQCLRSLHKHACDMHNNITMLSATQTRLLGDLEVDRDNLTRVINYATDYSEHMSSSS